ncbi:ABC transporter G family [Raphidocelis subcapitata]|uniref:ABC transporter G family n=1 Tax=Raphidocelis subcapitata TaxID=307507 RepID=A0A2V0P7N8_9CHLO|nr:ABC transporter G family [Raphidocelis subcapitata]|eukprot:GBF93870.1 ABC transporter G family [Raphidocelis subcapitata]
MKAKALSYFGVHVPLQQPASPMRGITPDLWRTQLEVSRVRNPLLLSWEDVGCAYSTPVGIKRVLQDVSGAANPFELLALMGPSGAGKSTLLDILAARKTVGRLTGRVCVNGAPRTSDFVRRISYVPQEDNFMPAMTVQETCALHAALKLPRDHNSHEQAAARIADVLCSMGMLHARDTLVGGELPGGLMLRGLSGGERRRLSVAVGILASPSIVFLDEPTSGLDACSALAVVEHLRDRARESGIAVVASIHQPRAAVWACFDACAVLSLGFSMYHGPCSDLIGWFQGHLGYGPWDSAVHGTASDWVMDLVNVGFTKGELPGFTIATRSDLEQAARKFSVHYKCLCSAEKQHPGEAPQKHQQQQPQKQQQQQQQQSESAVATRSRRRGSRASAAASEAGLGMPPPAPPPPSALAHADSWPLRPQQGTAVLRLSTGGGSGRVLSTGGFSAAAWPTLGGAASGGGASAGFSSAAAFSVGGAASLGGGALAARASSGGGGRSARGSPRKQQQQQQADGPKVALARSHSRPLITVETLDCGSSEVSGVELCEVAAAVVDRDKQRPGWWIQFKTLFARELLVTMRNPADVAGRMLLFTWVGVFCGLIFWGLGSGLDGVRNRVNLLFIVVQLFMLLPYVYMSLYAADRRHFTADIAARLYTPGPYYVAKTLGVLPFALANVLLCSLIVYGMAGLRLSATSAVVNSVAGVLTYLIAAQVQALAAIIMRNEDGAFVVTIAWTAGNIFLSNFIIRFSDMAHGWLRALRFLSAANYAFSAVLRAEFGSGFLSCDGGLSPDLIRGLQTLLPATPALRSSAVLQMAARAGSGCVVDLEAVLDYFDVRLSMVSYIAVLALYLWVMHVITYAALLLLAKRERR